VINDVSISTWKKKKNTTATTIYNYSIMTKIMTTMLSLDKHFYGCIINTILTLLAIVLGSYITLVRVCCCRCVCVCVCVCVYFFCESHWKEHCMCIHVFVRHGYSLLEYVSKRNEQKS
jgi:hypothetical protein